MVKKMDIEQRKDVFFENYREAVKDHIKLLEEYALANDVPIIRRGTRDVLRYLLRTKKPKRILEVGTAIGYSSLYMASICQDAKIFTIEKVEMRLVEARKNLAKYDKANQITLLEGDATEVLRSLVEKKESFDFIFMDAAKGQYLNFLPDVMELLNSGGVLVSDNILHDGDILESRYAVTRRDRTIHARMREYLKVLTDNEHLETLCLSVGDGMSISTKE